MIKNIVLDFGGVLVDIDASRSYKGLAQLLDVPEGQAVGSEVLDILQQYELGAFGEASFMHRLQRLSSQVISERDILDAWNAMLLDLPYARLDYLLNLRQDYKIYLLSNTNHTHIEWIRSLLRRRGGVQEFEQLYFDKVFYSYKLGMRKPHQDIYRWVTELLSIHPHETLFVDDTVANVVEAQNIGWHARVHDPNKEIIHELPRYIADIHRSQ